MIKSSACDLNLFHIHSNASGRLEDASAIRRPHTSSMRRPQTSMGLTTLSSSTINRLKTSHRNHMCARKFRQAEHKSELKHKNTLIVVNMIKIATRPKSSSYHRFFTPPVIPSSLCKKEKELEVERQNQLLADRIVRTKTSYCRRAGEQNFRKSREIMKRLGKFKGFEDSRSSGVRSKFIYQNTSHSNNGGLNPVNHHKTSELSSNNDIHTSANLDNPSTQSCLLGQRTLEDKQSHSQSAIMGELPFNDPLRPRSNVSGKKSKTLKIERQSMKVVIYELQEQSAGK